MAKKQSAPAPAAPDAGELRMVPLAEIAAGPANPRKTFDPDALKQLADSIREKGVLEPVIVRPRKGVEHAWSIAPANDAAKLYTVFPAARPSDKSLDRHVVGADAAKALAELLSADHFELVAGERRVRASRLAGLTHVPALVRDLGDKAAAEIAVIENDQREDVAPLEQAEGYARLVTMGDEPDAIAVKIGRPVKYVVNRLTLTNLIPAFAEDLRADKLPFGHAHMLARLSAADQQTLADPKGNHAGVYDYSGQPIPLKRLRERLREGFLSCLSAAPWKKDDATLVPAAGACSACPKRTAANPTLFDELLNGEAKKGRDFCTDLSCYAGKREAFVELQLRTAKGQAGAEPLRLTTDFYHRDKAVLHRGQYEILSKKEARSADPAELKTAVVIDDEGDGVGRIVQVRVKKSATIDAAANSFDREQKARERKAKAGKAAALVANGQVAARVLKAAGDPTSAAFVKLFKPLVVSLTDAAGADACRAIANRRKLPKDNANQRGRVEDLVAALDTLPELLALLAEAAAAKQSWSWGFSYGGGESSAEAKAFWSAFGVDRKKLVADAMADAKEKKAAKPKAKAAWAK